nr:MAG TPA: hypothetical protein [Caudoviricetes sp.]
MYIKIPTELNQYLNRPGLVLFYSCMASMAEGKRVAKISISNDWFYKHLGLTCNSVYEYGVLLEDLGLLKRNKVNYKYNEDGFWAKRDWEVNATLYNKLMRESTPEKPFITVQTEWIEQYRLDPYTLMVLSFFYSLVVANHGKCEYTFNNKEIMPYLGIACKKAFAKHLNTLHALGLITIIKANTRGRTVLVNDLILNDKEAKKSEQVFSSLKYHFKKADSVVKKRSKSFNQNLKRYVKRVMDSLWEFKVKGWEFVKDIYDELFGTYKNPVERYDERESLKGVWASVL